MFTIEKHILHRDGKPVAQRASPNHGGVIKPTCLVMHYTASSSESGAISWLCNPQAKASAHLVIGEAGSVTQLYPLNVRGWHAGPSSWGGKRDVNSFSIGIEMVNAGLLVKRGDGQYAEALSKKVVPAKGVILAAHKNDKTHAVCGWDDYPDAQFRTTAEIARVIVETYGIVDKNLVGHEDVCPGRKTDPGPAFNWNAFRSLVYGRDAAPKKVA